MGSITTLLRTHRHDGVTSAGVGTRDALAPRCTLLLLWHVRCRDHRAQTASMAGPCRVSWPIGLGQIRDRSWAVDTFCKFGFTVYTARVADIERQYPLDIQSLTHLGSRIQVSFGLRGIWMSRSKHIQSNRVQ
jgi:hypothetical protein